jgi:hypothetical protein
VILEIRTYRLVPGSRDGFVRLVRDESLPLLERHGITVVAHGVSLVSEDGHEEAYLIRAFPSLDAHAEQEARFYASDDWRQGPREAILALIESYHSVVLEVTSDVADSFARSPER